MYLEHFKRKETQKPFYFGVKSTSGNGNRNSTKFGSRVYSADDVTEKHDRSGPVGQGAAGSPAPPMTSCALHSTWHSSVVSAQVKTSTPTPDSCGSRCHSPRSRRPARARRGSIRDTSTSGDPRPRVQSSKRADCVTLTQGNARSSKTARSSDTR